ncbi:MAG: hypothetical protein U9R58_11560 [Chloroflexota bacterium]|nr:hypothetical protein [Chloroflexota bacterium]
MYIIIYWMVKRTYTAYGLIFQSDIEFPELIEASGQKDVSLCIGEVPDNLESFKGESQLYQVHKNQFLLKLEGVANYFVHNGNEIVIQPSPQSTDSEVRLFLLGTCLGVLLHQRGILALHASSIETKNGAVLFTGPRGIGKSTLMAAFLQRGYFMLADDITGIVLDRQGKPVVLPAIPRSKLWADAIQYLGHDLNTLPRLRPSEDKFELPVRERFAHSPAVIRHIYWLNTNEQNKIEIEALDHLRGFQVVLNNTYREFFLDGLERRESHFQLATTTARCARINSVSHPVKFHQLNELVKLIEADFLTEY